MYKDVFTTATESQIKDRVENIFKGRVAMTPAETKIMQDFLSRYSSGNAAVASALFNNNFVMDRNGNYVFKPNRTNATPANVTPNPVVRTFNSYSEVISSADNPLTPQNVKKIADIYIESGFANEGSFFRTFKAVTGMTPKEWLSKA